MQTSTLYKTIDVGGTLFKVSNDTLRIAGPHFLATLADMANDVVIFVDRDPELFRYVLLFLRGYSNFLPKEEDDRFRLLDDAKFYGISPLTAILNQNLGNPTDGEEQKIPPWMKDAYIAKIRRCVNNAINLRQQNWEKDETKVLASEQFVHEQLGVDANFKNDDLSTWSINTLQTFSDKAEQIEMKLQFVQDVVETVSKFFARLDNNIVLSVAENFVMALKPKKLVKLGAALMFVKTGMEMFWKRPATFNDPFPNLHPNDLIAQDEALWQDLQNIQQYENTTDE